MQPAPSGSRSVRRRAGLWHGNGAAWTGPWCTRRRLLGCNRVPPVRPLRPKRSVHASLRGRVWQSGWSRVVPHGHQRRHAAWGCTSVATVFASACGGCSTGSGLHSKSELSHSALLSSNPQKRWAARRPVWHRGWCMRPSRLDTVGTEKFKKRRQSARRAAHSQHRSETCSSIGSFGA